MSGPSLIPSPLVVVVGAGPAGSRAALSAARCGARVVLVDSSERVGGRYGRRPAAVTDGEVTSVTHPLEVAVAVQHRIEHLAGATVWALEPGPAPGRHLVHLQQGPADDRGRPVRTLTADALVLCTGAFDRTLPFPGWELPGVVTAGAAQALAEGQRTAVGARAVVSGTGPFLLPVALSLLDVGAHVLGVYEAGNPARWLRSPAAALRDGGPGRLAELGSYAAGLARGRVPYRTRHAVVAAHGRDRVEAVTVARLDAGWHPVPGSEQRLAPVDAVCVGYGFTPQLELPLAAGCAVRDGHVVIDGRQATTVPGVYAAGELTGIAGAPAAAAEGELAGLSAVADLAERQWVAAAGGTAPGAGLTPPPPARLAAVAARVRSGQRFGQALARAHPVPGGWRGWLREDTLVCRCEEVSYGELRDAVVARGADGMRALKLACRAGLGACQGRVCGRNTAELAAAFLGAPVADPHAMDRRPLAHPVRLGDLAGPPDGAGDVTSDPPVSPDTR
ncbi:FAD-dependent oxidoreductase [Streptomyces roseoverticillatus]|uniref:FAD-dependent oxidoreductase n=1 Tax=Streptomyces roseoverticillatus TaxID=66429 RepID=UPI0006940725|nr:FAD-dependent oxidoreductase [Streptomyces roseoverticillatus]